MWWSYILTAVGVAGLYLAGRGYWWSWLIGFGAQALWVAYAIATRQWGFIISAVAYGSVYFRNARKWWKDQHQWKPCVPVSCPPDRLVYFDEVGPPLTDDQIARIESMIHERGHTCPVHVGEPEPCLRCRAHIAAGL